MAAEQRQPPEPVRPERVLGLQAEDELFELVHPVERRHARVDRARGRAEVEADPRPEVALAEALEEADLEQETVDPAAREDDGDVALPFHLPAF